MKMERGNVQLPAKVKGKPDTLRGQGMTAGGFVRHLIEQEFSKASGKKTSR